jgi:hypothetical protein
MRYLLILLLCLVYTPVAPAQGDEERAMAKSLLRDLQADSIRGNREYCGLIGQMDDGRFVATKAVRGSRAKCRYPRPLPGMNVTATFHTHGAFLRHYDNEVPSVLDVMTDMSNGTNGYVSTPGGRLWFVDGRRGQLFMICGPGCLPWDPRFIEGAAGPIAGKYTLRELRDRQR